MALLRNAAELYAGRNLGKRGALSPPSFFEVIMKPFGPLDRTITLAIALTAYTLVFWKPLHIIYQLLYVQYVLKIALPPIVGTL